MRAVCVFAGSNPGTRPVYEQMAEELERELTARGQDGGAEDKQAERSQGYA